MENQRRRKISAKWRVDAAAKLQTTTRQIKARRKTSSGRGYKLNVCQRQNYTYTHAHVHVYTLPTNICTTAKSFQRCCSQRAAYAQHTHTRLYVCVCMYIAYIYCTYAAGLYKTGLSPCCCRWRRCRFIRALNVGPCGSLSACGASAKRKKQVKRIWKAKEKEKLKYTHIYKYNGNEKKEK